MSLLSWESELYAAVSTGTEGLRLPTGLRDLWNNTRVRLACDNHAVADHMTRPGLGLPSPLHTRHLWLQAGRDEGRLDVVKFLTEKSG